MIIRKLPEVSLSGRNRQIVKGPLPVWISFESSGGMFYRSQAVFENDLLIERYQTGQFMNRLDFQPRITTALRWKDWSLVPSFAVRETYYGESQTPYQDRFRVVGAESDPQRARFFGGPDRPFAGAGVRKQKLAGRQGEARDRTARLVPLHHAGVDDFNRVIRFDPSDLVSDAKYAEVRIINRIFAKRGNEVSEVFTWDLAQRRYLDPTFGGAVLTGQRNVLLSTVDLTPYAFVDARRNQSPGGFGCPGQPEAGLRRGMAGRLRSRAPPGGR